VKPQSRKGENKVVNLIWEGLEGFNLGEQTTWETSIRRRASIHYKK